MTCESIVARSVSFEVAFFGKAKSALTVLKVANDFVAPEGRNPLAWGGASAKPQETSRELDLKPRRARFLATGIAGLISPLRGSALTGQPTWGFASLHLRLKHRAPPGLLYTVLSMRIHRQMHNFEKRQRGSSLRTIEFVLDLSRDAVGLRQSADCSLADASGYYFPGARGTVISFFRSDTGGCASGESARGQRRRARP
jgi:hypothetical protein